MKIKYLGHSCFEFETGGHKILIDPFLVKSPDYNPNYVCDIFITHGHGDHLGSRKTGATITAIFELANYCASKGATTNGINFGSWVNYDWGRVIMVPAFHSSSTPEGIYAGIPCGFIFEIENKKIYHAGDTGLNNEMKMIGEIYKPDISILPIGGCYTMDIEHAIIASEWLNTNMVIPMHYNTFDAIKVKLSEFETKLLERQKTPKILGIGQILE